jgi:hypothetical protein
MLCKCKNVSIVGSKAPVSDDPGRAKAQIVFQCGARGIRVKNTKEAYIRTIKPNIYKLTCARCFEEWDLVLRRKCLSVVAAPGKPERYLNSGMTPRVIADFLPIDLRQYVVPENWVTDAMDGPHSSQSISDMMQGDEIEWCDVYGGVLEQPKSFTPHILLSEFQMGSD